MNETNIPNMVTLHGYEVEMIDRASSALRARQDVMIEAPTGAGKTLMARVVSWRLVAEGAMRGVLVAAPQGHIEDGFAKDCDQLIDFRDGRQLLIPARRFEKAKAFGRSGSISKTIGEKLSGPGHVMTCTHSGLAQVGVGPEVDLDGWLLVVDEAHHAPAESLAMAISTWKSRGGRLLYLTATAYRADGKPVAAEGMLAIRRTLDQHMAEGMAPRRLIHAIEPIGRQGDRIGMSQLTGMTVSSSQGAVREIADRMVARWEVDGRPKAIVGVPPLRGGSGSLIRTILAAFSRAGARTLDATGEGDAHKTRFLEALASERGRTFGSSQYDVIVGCGRVTEGTDWPVCSTVYRLGIPGSIAMAVQFTGRATRKKPESYPLPDREIARTVYFVPTAGGQAIERLSAHQARHVLMICVFLAEREAGASWFVSRAIWDGLKGNLAGLFAEDPEAEAEVKASMAAELEANPSATVGELVDAVIQKHPEVDPAAIQKSAIEMMAGADEEAGDAARETIVRAIRRPEKIGPSIEPEIREAFAAILDEFRGRQASIMKPLQGLTSMATSLTGRGVRYWVNRLAASVPVPLTDDQIVEAAMAYHSRHGKYPTNHAGPDEILGASWDSADRQLAKRGSSLARLLDARGLKPRQRSDEPMPDDDRIADEARKYHARHSAWPNGNSGYCEVFGRTWGQVHGSLRACRGSSLREVLESKGLVDKKVMDATEDQIVEAAVAYRAGNGKWPDYDSGYIPPLGRTWSSIHNQLVAAGTGLKRLLDARGLAERRGKPIPEELIIEAGRRHFEEHKKFPVGSYGQDPIPGIGKTWTFIACRLKSRGMTIKQFLISKGVGDPLGVPSELVVKAAEDHESRHGSLPVVQSEQSDMLPVQWNTIHKRLKKQGSGLPQFFQQHGLPSRPC